MMVGDLKARITEHRQQLQQDKLQDRIHGDTLLTEGVKATILLNSGAIVATLGFMQSTVGKAGASEFISWAVIGASLFLLGAIFSVSTFFVRQRRFKAFNRWAIATWRALTVVFAVGGVALFAAGVIALLVGSSRAFVDAKNVQPTTVIGLPAQKASGTK